MKITKDEQTGKLIFDFEGATINIEEGVELPSGMGFVASLFNPDVVLAVRNGFWKFPLKAVQERLLGVPRG